MPCLHLQDALHAAVRIGDDTDTVAAIAGGLLGARWGASAVPWRWRRAVHGWPGRDGRDLVTLAALTVAGGRADPKGWPVVEDVAYDEPASRRVVPHPLDDGRAPGHPPQPRTTARTPSSRCAGSGGDQACFDGADVVVESRLMDSEDPAANPNLAFTLRDAADAVRGLRAEGRTVLLHCVAAEQRTPSVAVEYGVLLGHGREVRRAVVGGRSRARGDTGGSGTPPVA